MPEKPKNNAESDFHRRRKAFIILNGGLLVASDGFEGSHFELLLQSGFDEGLACRLIAGQPRGYALNGNVYLYQGSGFLCLSKANSGKAREWIPFFQKSGWLAENGKIYDGMRAGKTGTVWEPIKEFEI